MGLMSGGTLLPRGKLKNRQLVCSEAAALLLKMKYQVIKMSDTEPKIGVRKLAELFQCGKTQVSTILKNEKAVKELYELNASSALCQAHKRNRTSEYATVNDALFQWYQMCVKRTIAERLGHTGFKASNGWLHRWKVRNNNKQRTVSGESADVRSDTEESWKSLSMTPLYHLQGYKAEDIWNVDETGCFWKAKPNKGLGQMKAMCKGGKKSKHRVTIAFFVNGVGQSESQPVVIWKSMNPRCFKGVRKESLPVYYYSQPKSRMTGDILHDILGSVNHKLRAKGRSIILLVDNASCHPSTEREI